MKKIIFILITFISVNCLAQNETNNELINKKKALKLEANYLLANDYLSKIERGDVDHMALTKIDKEITKSYWDNTAELKIYHENWKEASSKIGDFEKKHAPELAKLSNRFKKGTIQKEDYLKQNRQIRGGLTVDFPDEYKELSENHIVSLKNLWKQTGRYMLEDYKRKEKLFPTYWIPERERAITERSIEYQSINKALIVVLDEINKKR